MSDRTELWLALLQQLTADFPRWAVWKNIESALHGHGDVDSLADPADWNAIETAFRAWAHSHDLRPIIVCRHIPQGPHFLTLERQSPYLIQLDVKTRATLRGATLLDVARILPLAFIDEHGVRRIRPGAEGVIKLLENGMLHGGGCDMAALDVKRVRPLLECDPEGAELATMLAGAAAPALKRGIAAVKLGEWDVRAMRAVEIRFLMRAMQEPRNALSRLRFQRRTRRGACPVITTIRQHDRCLPDDTSEWLAEVRKTHQVDFR
ncbi:MAG TPA: hypothetical protein VGC44_09985 [Longimicrobiales bacterium]